MPINTILSWGGGGGLLSVMDYKEGFHLKEVAFLCLQHIKGWGNLQFLFYAGPILSV